MFIHRCPLEFIKRLIFTEPGGVASGQDHSDGFHHPPLTGGTSATSSAVEIRWVSLTNDSLQAIWNTSPATCGNFSYIRFLSSPAVIVSSTGSVTRLFPIFSFRPAKSSTFIIHSPPDWNDTGADPRSILRRLPIFPFSISVRLPCCARLHIHWPGSCPRGAEHS